MIEVLVATGLFSAPIWGNVYIWVMSGSHGFVVEALACAILSIILIIGCIIYRNTVLALPLHSATHATLAFGTTFSAVDLHRGDVYMRCAILLGFHAALFATFLYESNKREKVTLLKQDP